MIRRRLLQTLLFSPFASALPAQLNVTKLETFVVKVNRRDNWILARITTDQGLTGIGDASQGGSDELQLNLLGSFFEILKGRSIFDIEWLRRQLQPEIARVGRPATVALSALEQCLWDIRGKAFGVPVYELLGGRLHERLRNYANINRSTESRTPEGFAAMAEKAVASGFDAIKMSPFDGMPKGLTEEPKIQEFMKLGLDCAAAVRKVIGPGRDLLVDVHSHMDLAHGLELARRFEPLNLFWLEEVTPAEPLDNLAAINRAAKMPTAGGESIYGVSGFFPYIAARAVDIAMPDVKYCGGLLELKKIAAMAEGAGMPVAPHGPASPVGNMAAAHVCAGLPNFQILEFAFGEVSWRAELVNPPEELKDGSMAISNKPGLGMVLNEKTIAKYTV